MAIVNTAEAVTSKSCEQMIRQIVERYPFCRTETLGETVFHRPIQTLVVGNGPRKVLYSAAHHANEWITTLVLLKFAEALAEAAEAGGRLFGYEAARLLQKATIYMVPMVDPDGVDLVTGAITKEDAAYGLAKKIAEGFPQIPFPQGWKANLRGIDLNLNYPAGWLQAREMKFMQGFNRPAPRDYVGRAPLDQPETRLLAGYTERIRPELVLAYHSQGREIYWRFGDLEPAGARELGERFAQLSGYRLADAPEGSGYAGYKDWFIQCFRRPGYTIEVGSGVNPLPLTQFDEIYKDNLGILVTGALGE